MESLKYWLEKIAKNDELTHWEINVIIRGLESEIPSDLMLEIRPMINQLKDKGGINHTHKKLIAEFTLKLIEKYEDRKKNSFF